MSAVTIKLAGPKDAAKVLAFLRQTATESNAVQVPHLLDVSLEQEADNIKMINQFDDCVVMLAMLDDEPVGIVTVMMLAEQPETGELGVVVEKKYWRNGIGQLLVDEAEYWFTHYSSLTRLVLAVFADNTPAIALYRKMHFKKTGTTIEDGRLALLMEYQPE
ncbi:GNAT family N-acetyltransferase [Limosilactobacillus panis]|jgi:RimJ/RimL family protein N-acetyltransferase|uniref:GNAT family N-acetyltransferase n=1 Tax=Limosilactobacillus panis TaxID=47493 RepID=UPI001C95A7EF|nr:GNAT family N-acetyltransferase [Limosilactobacillus panis]QZN93520.1 GNAT family N-acetyltransferase [Limosilactobacillus panis]